MTTKTNKSTCSGMAACGFFAASLAFLPTLTMANETDDPADVIVVTGSRVSDQLTELSNSTNVIGRSQIEAQNHSNVLDLLRNSPGIMVSQPGGRGGVANLFVRGGEPNFTMVMLDGVRVNDPNNTRGGSFDFSTLNMQDIERIEIVRGPQSAIYGSDALSGVVNIISKGRAETLGVGLNAEIGEEGFERYAIDIAGPIGAGGGFSLRAASVDDGDITEGNTYTSESVSGKLIFGAEDGWSLRVFGRYSDNAGTSFPEDSGGAELAVMRLLDVKSSEDVSFGAAGSFPLASNWTLNVTANQYDHDDSYASPGVAPGVRDGVPPNGADSSLDRSSMSANVVADISSNFRATFGVDYYDEQGSSDGYVDFAPGFSIPTMFEIDRNVTGVFAEVRYHPVQSVTLLASLRNDDPDGESGETTAKLGGLFEFNGGRSILRANWGEGFKLPSFYALANPLVGNPDLKSERSDSADISITQHVNDRMALTLTLYRSVFEDLIDFDFDLFTNVNRTEVTAQGAELQLDYQLSDALHLSAEAMYLDLDVKDSDTPLRQRPDWRGSVSMLWDINRAWRWHASWMLQGETFDSSIPTGGLMLDGYNRLDTALTWLAGKSLNVQLSVDNLLDENYAEAIGFPAASRRARLAVRYRF